MEKESKDALTDRLLDDPPADAPAEPGAVEKTSPTVEILDVEEQQNEESEALLLEQDWTRGETQGSACRDWPFAAFFLAQLAAVAVVAVKLGIPALEQTSNGGGGPSPSPTPINGTVADVPGTQADPSFVGILYLTLIAGGGSIAVTSISLAIMMRYAQFLVEFSLVYSMVVSLVLMVVFGVQQVFLAAVLFFLAFVIECCYAWAVWHRIPFAAANLNAASTAIRDNYGVTGLAHLFLAVALCWSGLWVLAVVGVFSVTNECDENGVCEGTGGALYLCLLLLSYFWTQQVIQNTMHVTIAGVVGTWWFSPSEASSCCSSAIWNSLVRSVTTSFGSICFGSLLVAVLQTLRQLVHRARQQGEDNALLCLLECLIACIESLLEYFNKWAYVYVGLYGYNYLEAGKNVMTLFRQRGWTTIITDDLVSGALSLTCFIVGSITGVIGYIVAVTCKSWVLEFGDAAPLISFLFFFMIGLVMASILVSVVDSAVNTVVVCFAEAPNEFQSNHAELSLEMREGWRKVYRDECGF